MRWALCARTSPTPTAAGCTTSRSATGSSIPASTRSRPRRRGSSEAIAESAGRQPKQAGFTIYDRADGSPVGTSGLHGIDWRYSRATFGIAIGAGRGRGLGTEATRLTLDWGFNILGLQNVMLTVLPSNAGAIRVYEKAGFKRIGARRNALVLLGERCDEVLMDVVRDEFDSPVLAAQLSYSRRSSRSLAQRGSGALSCAWPGSSLRLAPHSGHRPAQSTRHTTWLGSVSA